MTLSILLDKIEKECNCSDSTVCGGSEQIRIKKEGELTKMRVIEVSRLTEVIEKLCIEANEHLPADVKDAIKTCRACEDGEIAKGVLDNIIENYEIADQENVPICQDTGMACVFLEIGQDVHLVGGDLTDAVNEGVRRGYDRGYLRKSVVKDPVRRGNT